MWTSLEGLLFSLPQALFNPITGFLSELFKRRREETGRGREKGKVAHFTCIFIAGNTEAQRFPNS